MLQHLLSHVQQPAAAAAWLRTWLLLPCILHVTALLLHIRNIQKLRHHAHDPHRSVYGNEEYRSAMHCATSTLAKAKACTSVMPDSRIAAGCHGFLPLLCPQLPPCFDVHKMAGQLLYRFELCVCAHLQVPEYVRLCLHDVAEVRPLSLKSLHACHNMVKLLDVYNICTGMYVLQAKQQGNQLGRCLVMKLVRNLQSLAILPWAANIEALQHLLVADQLLAKRLQRWESTGC